MKITPLEIRQKKFEKAIRGYDKEEVDAFLLSLSQEWERVADEQKELKMKFANSEKEAMKLREVESSLFKTLKTAEDSGSQIVEHANKSADLRMKETNIQIDAIMYEAESKAKDIIENAEYQASRVVEDMRDYIKQLEGNYNTLESYKETLILELKNASNDVLEKVERVRAQEDVHGKNEILEAAKKVASDVNNAKVVLQTLEGQKKKPAVSHEQVVEEEIKVEVPKENLVEKEADPVIDTLAEEEEKKVNQGDVLEAIQNKNKVTGIENKSFFDNIN